ncbi:MAG TPA: hypothetical protein VMA72_12245 [Streptosporangiaceae bacterium]|nr:hypothetical protein [Streptosporangiaceae bacterium]
MGTSESAPSQLLAEFQNGMNERLQQFRQLAAPLDTMGASPERVTLALQVIQLLTQTETFISTYAQRAEELQRSGFPELATSIAAGSQDIQTAKLKYQDIYQNTGQTLEQSNQAWTNAQQTALQNILQGTAHQQAVFDSSMRGIMAADNRQCPNCQFYLGDAYPYWNVCPRCHSPL